MIKTKPNGLTYSQINANAAIFDKIVHLIIPITDYVSHSQGGAYAPMVGPEKAQRGGVYAWALTKFAKKSEKGGALDKSLGNNGLGDVIGC